MALKRAAVNTAQTTAQDEANVNAQADTAVDQAGQVEQANEPEQVLETREEQDAANASAEANVDESPEQEAQDEPEPEAQVEQAAQVHQEVQAETRSEPAKEVAVKGDTAVAVSGQDAMKGAMASYTQNMAELGFEGLNITGMSFDRVKLTEGKFVLGSDEISLGESIDIQLMGTKPIFIVRQYDGDDAEIYFSYDKNGEFLTDGSSSAEIREKWLEDGYGGEDAPLDIKRYLEGMAQLVNRTDEYNGHMVSLSIPPASTDRLGGACAVGYQKFKRDPSGLVITCKVGAKIQKGSISWRPWVFIAKGPYNGE